MFLFDIDEQNKSLIYRKDINLVVINAFWCMLQNQATLKGAEFIHFKPIQRTLRSLIY